MAVKKLFVPVYCDQITRQLEFALQGESCEQSCVGCSAASHRLYLYVPDVGPSLATSVLKGR
jgi:hypothetical protein